MLNQERSSIVGTSNGWRFGYWPAIGRSYAIGNMSLRCINIDDTAAYFTPDYYMGLPSNPYALHYPNSHMLTEDWIYIYIGADIHGTSICEIARPTTFKCALAVNERDITLVDLEPVLPYFRKQDPLWFKNEHIIPYVVSIDGPGPTKDDSWRCTVRSSGYLHKDELVKICYSRKEILEHFRPVIAIDLKRFVNPSEKVYSSAFANIPNLGLVSVGSELYANCAQENGKLVVVEADSIVDYDDVKTLVIRVVSILQTYNRSSVIGSTDFGDVDLMLAKSLYPDYGSAHSVLEAELLKAKIPVSKLATLSKETLKRISAHPELLDMTK